MGEAGRLRRVERGLVELVLGTTPSGVAEGTSSRSLVIK